MSDSAQEKTLPATPQRLKKARDDGQVARSKDLLNLAVLGAGSAVLMLTLPLAFGLREPGFKGTAPVKRDVQIPETITVGELANRMAIKANEVIKTMMKMGVMATINQTIDHDVLTIEVSGSVAGQEAGPVGHRGRLQIERAELFDHGLGHFLHSQSTVHRRLLNPAERLWLSQVHLLV